MKNIVLIGFMATGKSTIGRRLALQLNRDFVDTDKEIEKITGMTVAQIFAKDGIRRFRSEENLLAKRLAPKEDLVIATGGGMVLNPENMRLLKENGVLITLTAAPDIICTRVKGKKTRPLLQGGALDDRISRLLKERQDLYDQADLVVDTGTCSVGETVEKIISSLSERKDI
jgi:shikimate kinase